MSSLPVVNQPPHRCGALLGQLTRRLQTRSESVLTPLGPELAQNFLAVR